MSTPYRLTPRAPAVPHSTPMSTTVKEGHSQRRTTRAPTLNPFDKFGKEDFDSWILGITCTLRQALGQEVEELPSRPTQAPVEPVQRAPAELAFKPVSMDTEEEEDDVFEDSFADMRMRRALNKGKGRDPREGPGLVDGRKEEEAIEILSGSEEEDEDEEGVFLPIKAASIVSEDVEQGEDDGDDFELYEEEEEGLELVEEEEEEASDKEAASHRYSAHREEIQRAMQAQRSAHIEHEEYGSSDEEDRQDATPPNNRRQDPPEIISLDSDDEEPPQVNQAFEDDDEIDELQRGSSPIDGAEEQDLHEEDNESNFYDNVERENHDEEDDEDVQLNAKLVDSGEDDEPQPLDEDTSCPPMTHRIAAESTERPEIRDPWSGPQAYAEDFYSGGDRPLRRGHPVDAHHIEDEEDGEYDDEELMDEDDEADDEVFVPRRPETRDPSTQVQIRDVWEGPEKYAEDYYSGGDAALRHDKPANADLLEVNGGHDIIDLDQDDLDEDGLEEPSVSFLPLSGARDAFERRSTPPSTLAAHVSSGQHASLQGLQNGHAYDDSLNEFGELGGAIHDDLQHRSDDASKFLFESYSDAQRGERSSELQDVLASPSRPTFSDSETVDADFDLEYPEISTPPSTTRNPGFTGEAALSTNGTTFGSDPLADKDPLLGTNHPASEDDIHAEGAESLSANPGVPEDKLHKEAETVDAFEAPLMAMEVDAQVAGDYADVAMKEGAVEDTGSPSGAGALSEPTMELLDGSQGMDADVSEPSIFEPANASQTTQPGIPTEPIVLYSKRALREDVFEPEHPTEDFEYVERLQETPERKHHPVTIEEVTDEEADEPLHPAAPVETSVGLVDEDMVEVDSLAQLDQVTRNEPSVGKVGEGAMKGLQDDEITLDEAGDSALGELSIDDVVEDTANERVDPDEGAVNRLDHVALDEPTVKEVIENGTSEHQDDDAMEELDDEDADAYGELEDDDIEVLSISSSSDFPVLPHVEDEAEVEEPDPGEDILDLKEPIIAHKEPNSEVTPEVRPFAVDEESDHSSVELLEGEAASDIAVDETSASPAPEGGYAPELQIQGDLLLVSDPKQTAGDGAMSDFTMSSVGEVDMPPNGARESAVPQQDLGLSSESKGGLADSPTASTDHLGEAQTTEDHSGDSLAEPSPSNSHTEAIAADFDNEANPSEEIEPLVEASNLGPSVENTRNTLSTLPPQEDIKESKADVMTPDFAAQPASEPETLNQQPSSLEGSSVSHSGTVEVTTQISSVTITTTFEPLSATSSAPESDTLVTASHHEGPAAGSPADGRSVDEDVPVVNAPKGAESEDTDARQQRTRDDVEDVKYLPSPESLNDVSEVEGKAVSPNAVTPLSDTRPSPTPELDLVQCSPDNTSDSAAQLEQPIHPTYPATAGISTQRGSPADNQEAPSGSEILTASPSASIVDRASHSSPLSSIAASVSPEIALKESKTSSPIASNAPPPQPASSTKLSTQTKPGKRKRDGPSPKKGSRGTGASRRKSNKGKGKPVEEAPLDGGDEILVKPRKRTKLLESDLASVEGGSRPPASTSAASVQSGSSASSAARLLQPSSRASSVAVSEASEQTSVSPTTSKAPGVPQRGASGWVHYGLVPDAQPQASSPLLQTTFAGQRPFLHAHGRNKAPLQLQQYRTIVLPDVQQPTSPARPQPTHTSPAPPPPPPPPPASAVPAAENSQHGHMRRSSAAHRISIPPPSPSGSHPPHSPQTETVPQTPTSSLGQLSQAPTPQGPKPANGARRTQSMKARSATTHTPVTRSHCRFHKISLPKEEFGPRVHFIVPGCSLTRYKVIEDEEIEDHGDATYEESQRMVEEIETLGFDDYLISVLKSLVGSEIMQQREVYYLPAPGETIIRHPSTSATHPVASTSKGRTSGVGASASISARGVGGDTLEDLGLSETDSDHTSSDDSDYGVKPSAPKKTGNMKQPTAKKSIPRRSNKSLAKRPRTQDAAAADETEDGRDAKKTRLDDSPASQPAPGVPGVSRQSN